MDPALLSAVGVLATLVPSPWGPILAAAAKILPAAQAGQDVVAAALAADPSLLQHLEQAGAQIGVDPSIILKGIFAPHQMTAEEEKRWMDRASGGPGH